MNGYAKNHHNKADVKPSSYPSSVPFLFKFDERMASDDPDCEQSAGAKAEAPADNTTPKNNNDFVIREGFPALRLPNGDPWINGEEPLPRHSFWAHETALTFDDKTLLQLQKDCETVFSARAKDDDHAYSAGVTYFCPSQMKPRCALESFVLSIFRKHTEALDQTTFIPEQSGAEWWTLVLDEEEEQDNIAGGDGSDDNDEEDESDEVGMHFDADYGLEDQAPNLLLHPRIGTVTYLSDFGAPTIVLNRRSPPPNDIEKKALAGPIDKGWLSHPRIGKHIAFDGRLLHGAPATFFPDRNRKMTEKCDDTKPPANKKARLEEKKPGKRYTLLVNLWLNHCPLDAELLEDDVVSKLVTPMQATATLDGKDKKPASDSERERLAVWSEDFNPATRDTDSGVKVSLEASATDPAGEEETVICGRRVTVHYRPSMDDLHQKTTCASLLELAFGEGALALEVGEVVEDESEDEED